MDLSYPPQGRSTAAHLTTALLLFNQIFRIFKVGKYQNVFAMSKVHLWCRVTTWAVILHQLIQSLTTPTRDAIPQTPTVDSSGVSQVSPKPGVPQAALPCPSEATPPSPRQRQARTLRRSRQLAIPPRSSREMSSRRVLQTLGKLLAHARGSAPPGRVPVSPCPPPAVSQSPHATLSRH